MAILLSESFTGDFGTIKNDNWGYLIMTKQIDSVHKVVDVS